MLNVRIKGVLEVLLEGWKVINVTIYWLYGCMVSMLFLKSYIPHILLLLLGTMLLAVGCW